MNLRTISCAIMVVLTQATSAVFADEIQLTNGDIISGKIVNKTNDAILINTSYAGDISIEWEAITTLKSEAPITVQLDDESLLKGTLITSQDGTVKVSSDKIYDTAPIPLNRIAAINPPPVEPEKTKFTGIANLGAFRSTGNTDNQSIHLDAEMVARRTNDRLTFGGAYNQAENNGVESAKNALGYAKYDYFINDKWYAYGNTLFENDEFQDLKLRSLLGAGLGYQFWETDISNLSLEAGPAYVNEDFYTATDKDFAAGRWSVNYDRWFYQKALQFFHFHEGLVPFSDTGDIYIRSRTGVRIPLFRKFTVTAEVDVDYDAKPALGNKKTDTYYLLNAGYRW